MLRAELRSGSSAALPAACVALISVVAWTSPAGAFCRTSTCPLPPDFAPSPSGCQPQNFETYCASLDPPVVPLPVWWRNACVSYDIQQDASASVPYDVAAKSFATAFGKWTGAACPSGGTPSVAVDDLGAVACDEVHYNDNTTGQGNQHVIIFRDGPWPHPSDLNNTLGLTTITFDPDTGEIYDADMEINSSVPLTVAGPVPMNGNDFMSIITHETGHFFGMAHSNDSLATMYAHYTPGSTYMRNLTADDVSGICSIYPPSGDRAVAATVADGGLVHEDSCDPTPRHGFQSACVDPPSKASGCAVDGPAPESALLRTATLLFMATAGAAFARRSRRATR